MGDSRSKMYPLMGSPIPFLCVIIFYVVFNFKVGPAMMSKREPFKIKKFIMSYNLLQIIFNITGIVFGIRLYSKVSLLCTPLDLSTDSPYVLVHYLYLGLKLFDLLDTVIFVLKKNHERITFLHIYHHVLMAVGSWATFIFIPGGQLFFLGFPNCIVHTVMYIYYFLISWNPKYKEMVWWKKHLTQLQIIQHCFIFTSFCIPLLNQNCTYPKLVLALFLPGGILMIFLFVHFYIKTYVKKSPSKKE
ncbi:elongation of very long chain fatty acids protein 1-like [Asbolus verrucosus]|uniref:Elongation of very long chain fatty acids protein n=1 Tax=Asbolus verrucosus TaxID=1661398 RepID=A0A482VLZ5_ASBVE|nr:elongation of very long chain fatty acids protein 1-like [Asbolus verrucosus]